MDVARCEAENFIGLIMAVFGSFSPKCYQSEAENAFSQAFKADTVGLFSHPREKKIRRTNVFEKNTHCDSSSADFFCASYV